MLKTLIEVPFSSASQAGAALKSLEQETEFKKRSRTALSVNGKVLCISIEADDLVALHATVNSYLRLLKVIFATFKETEGGI